MALEKIVNKIILPENVASRLENEETFSRGALFGVRDCEGFTTLIYPLFVPENYDSRDFKTLIFLAGDYQLGVLENYKKELDKSSSDVNSDTKIASIPFLIYKQGEFENPEEVIKNGLPFEIKSVTRDAVDSVLYMFKPGQIYIATAKVDNNDIHFIESSHTSTKGKIPEESITSIRNAVLDFEENLYDPENPNHSKIFLTQNSLYE